MISVSMGQHWILYNKLRSSLLHLEEQHYEAAADSWSCFAQNKISTFYSVNDIIGTSDF